ncbi:DNA translocase FtsK [Micromonospora sp. WMMA1363]|uniref:DNA translocase FtsK n=1 Tax=Micromonospora sp. WMMA1363 TaxID=3053985 RepID=UPI00259CAD5D|nr:DNA translocase FtsK [Micromonospora sp. WMMA1363]MDM4723493.1 DNA translocase FtsK [Micromonospora sp. WMMA1363]
MAAGQIAEIIVTARAEKLRQAAERDREAARVYRAQLDQSRAGAAELWRRAERDDWWRRASPADISRLWTSAASWQHVDPRAADTLSAIRDRLARRGVRVEQPTANPGDGAWLREAVNLAQEEQQATRAAGGTQAATAETVMRTSEERDLHATAVYQRLDGQDQQRIADAIQTGWPDKADDLTNCRAWPALAGRIWERGQAGHDMVETARLLSANDISRARLPAALTCWIFDRMALKEFAQRAEVIGGEVVEQSTEQTATVARQEAQPAEQPATTAHVDAAQLRAAAALVVESQFGSAAMLQRRMQIGFSEAGHLMNELETRGVVGASGDGARDVYVPREQLPQLLASLGTGQQTDHTRETETEATTPQPTPATATRGAAVAPAEVTATEGEVTNAARIAQGYPTPAAARPAVADGGHQAGTPTPAAQRAPQRPEAAAPSAGR